MRGSGLTVADVGEQGLIKRIQKLINGQPRQANAGVVVGVGDDAALVRAVAPGAVLTTDMLVEDVDFRLAWASWSDIGHKAAAVNLSDLAAMGARPRGLLLSLALRPHIRVADVMALVGTLARVGAHYGAPLVGGDLSKIDGPVVASVTAIGEVDPRKALRRYAGRVGDIVLVSGVLGGAAAGLEALQAGVASPLRKRQLRPTPNVALGMALAKSGLVRSAADISDGLASDALHVAPAGAGVTIDASALPLQAGVEQLARKLGKDAIRLAVAGGEDFELVIAVAPRNVPRVQALAKKLGQRLTVVGSVVKAPGLSMGRAFAAFDHFRRR
jgi:thiamine-monophosphate kinase